MRLGAAPMRRAMSLKATRPVLGTPAPPGSSGMREYSPGFSVVEDEPASTPLAKVGKKGEVKEAMARLSHRPPDFVHTNKRAVGELRAEQSAVWLSYQLPRAFGTAAAAAERRP